MDPKVSYQRFIAATVVFTIMFSALMLFVSNNTIYAQTGDTYSELEMKTLRGNSRYYLLEPSEAGTYPAVILLPGLGGMSRYEQNLVDYANNWARSGLIDKYVFICPYFPGNPDNDDRITDSQLYEYIVQGNMDYLVDQIGNGQISAKIDTSADLSIAGYSMGGCASLYAAINDTERLVNVGSLSPSFMLYRADEQWAWVRHGQENKFVFSSDPDAHIYLAASKKEHDGQRYQDMLRYERIIRGQGYDPVVEPFDEGEHDIQFFMKEIFSFLYLIENDELPSLELIEQAESGIPSETVPTEETGTTETTETEPSSSEPETTVTETEPTVTENTDPAAVTETVPEETSEPSVSETTPETTQVPEVTVTDTEETTPSDTPETGISGFVERLYTVALGRSSDLSGKQDWIEAITLRGETGADAARGFLYSPEFLNRDCTNEEFTTVLYRTFFDREPDAAGFDSWVAALDNGASKQDVIEGFINSTEWANLCLRYGIAGGGTGVPNIEVEPNQATIDFASRLYTTCLGRTADQDGLMAWARQLANQRDTGTGAARGFFFSYEFTNQNVSNDEYVNRLYRTFMGREADEAGFSAWVGQLESGTSREEVFNGFAQSQEFGQICASYGIIR
ncbi:MAG: DUF4214 domain-containing protein [Clostridiales bacterium]|nr:DUF4214 domain-containing protein [Clostridiales bacterium]